ncbi:hypothetical protein ACFUMI_26935, partial [Streptomyces sp. NPDC057273]
MPPRPFACSVEPRRPLGGGALPATGTVREPAGSSGLRPHSRLAPRNHAARGPAGRGRSRRLDLRRGEPRLT